MGIDTISVRLEEAPPPQMVRRPGMQERSQLTGPCANDLYERFLHGEENTLGEENTPFERVFNRTLIEVDSDFASAPDPWIALGKWAVMWGGELGHDHSTSEEFVADVSYYIDSDKRYTTEREIIKSIIAARRGRRSGTSWRLPLLMDRPLVLSMQKSARAERLHARLLRGEGIAVRNLRGLGAQVQVPVLPGCFK